MSDLALDLVFIIIVLLGTAVLGILVGYVIGLIKRDKELKAGETKWTNKRDDYIKQIKSSEKDLASCKNELAKIEALADDKLQQSEKRITELQTELSSFQEEKDELERRTKDLMKALAEVRVEVQPPEKEAVSDKKKTKNAPSAYNLKIVEGIGPKIEQILKEEGIDTWVKLSMTNPDEIRSLLISKGGSAYRAHDPRTWPYQAKLASEGLWDDLKDYQKKLTSGK